MTVTENATQQAENLNTKKRKHEELEDDHEDEESYSDEEEPQTLHIVVRRVGKSERESLVIELDSDASVSDLKERILETLEEQNEIAVPVERQRLIFSGKMLRDDSQLLEEDLNMKAGYDQKNFVHLTPLPKGAAPSVRTERELSENPLSPQEETLQRVRARQRRRRRQESERGMSDPAAYHPYALDLTSGSLLPASSGSASAAAAAAAAATAPLALAVASPAAEEALLSVTAEQSRLVQEAARRTILPPLPEALEAALLGQPVTNLLDAAARGGTAASLGSAASAAAAASALCPLPGQSSDAATSLLESALLGGRGPPANSAVSMLRFASPQLQSASAASAAIPTDTNPTVAALQELLGVGRPPQPPTEPNPTVAALQDILGVARPPPPQPTTAAATSTPGDSTAAALQNLLEQPQTQASLRTLLARPQTQATTIQLLEDIAANAGELASTLRAASLPTSVTSPPPPAAAAAATIAATTGTPQDLATRLALEQSLASLAAASPQTATILPGSFPPFF